MRVGGGTAASRGAAPQVSPARGANADMSPQPSIPAEGPAEHVRNALAILRAQLEQGAAAGDLALDLGAVVTRLERAVAALRGVRSLTAVELVAHWQTCTRCHADAADATARVTRRSWVSGEGDGT